jgi:hypothetical protein
LTSIYYGAVLEQSAGILLLSGLSMVGLMTFSDALASIVFGVSGVGILITYLGGIVRGASQTFASE